MKIDFMGRVFFFCGTNFLTPLISAHNVFKESNRHEYATSLNLALMCHLLSSVNVEPMSNLLPSPRALSGPSFRGIANAADKLYFRLETCSVDPWGMQTRK